MSNSRALTETVRPIVVISKCLEFEACRYDGQMISFDFVRKLRDHVTFVPTCPEVEIGLGTPRDPVKIVKRENDLHLVQPTKGRDISSEMRSYSEQFLDSLVEVDGFILKSRSPSCGIRDTRLFSDDDTESAIGKTSGFFGKAILDRHYGLPTEDEFRLADPRTRDHWLTRLFVHTRFREARATGLIGELEQFHDDNRLLLLAHEQFLTRRLDRIAENEGGLAEPDQWEAYRRLMLEAIRKPMRVSPQVNALSWAMGHFREHLGSGEKRAFLDMLALFGAAKIPRSAVTDRLKLWIEQYGNELLRRQSYFCPYPRELMDSPEETVQ